VLEQRGKMRVTAGRQGVQGREQSLAILIEPVLPVMVRMSAPHSEPIEGNIERLAEANSVIERHWAALAPSRQGAHGNAEFRGERGKLFDSSLLDRDTNALAASPGIGAFSRIGLRR
jgi:hypothetical protein